MVGLIDEQPAQLERIYHLAHDNVQIEYEGMSGTALSIAAMAELAYRSAEEHFDMIEDYTLDLVDQSCESPDYNAKGTESDYDDWLATDDRLVKSLGATLIASSLFNSKPSFRSLVLLDEAYENTIPSGRIPSKFDGVYPNTSFAISRDAWQELALAPFKAISQLLVNNMGDYSYDVVLATQLCKQLMPVLTSRTEQPWVIKEYADIVNGIREYYSPHLDDKSKAILDVEWRSAQADIILFSKSGQDDLRTLGLTALADLRDATPQDEPIKEVIDKMVERQARRAFFELGIGSLPFIRSKSSAELKAAQKRIISSTRYDLIAFVSFLADARV